MGYPTNTAFAVLSLLSVLPLLMISPFQWRMRNTGEWTTSVIVAKLLS